MEPWMSIFAHPQDAHGARSSAGDRPAHTSRLPALEQLEHWNGPGPEAPWETGVQAGDADTFTAIYRAYYAPLCNLARRYVRTPEAAEELVQDVLLRFWEQRSGWSLRESLRAYLHAAVQNQ